MIGLFFIDKFYFCKIRNESFFCPFCSSRYQLHKTRDDGVFICGHCGDPLKKTLLNLRRIIGVVVSSAFLTPLLIMFVFVVKDFTKENVPYSSETLLLSTIDN